jgi:hypothetical protein
MFGLAWLSIPLLITVFSVLAGIIRWIYTAFFSKNAKAEALLAWAERKKAEYKVERERLQASYDRIKKEPRQTDETKLVEDLNKKWNKP